MEQAQFLARLQGFEKREKKCPFLEKGAMAIGYDGSSSSPVPVSPRPAPRAPGIWGEGRGEGDMPATAQWATKGSLEEMGKFLLASKDRNCFITGYCRMARNTSMRVFVRFGPRLSGYRKGPSPPGRRARVWCVRIVARLRTNASGDWLRRRQRACGSRRERHPRAPCP